MRDFEYLTPLGLPQAAELLGKYGGKALLKAGGIDLLDLMKEGLATPAAIINLLPLEGLSEIADHPVEGLTLGPLVTLDAIASDATIKARYPVLAKASGEAATPQIRNVATIGGNLCQRPRCWYFRSADFPCLKKGGETCFAVDGDNRYHAILGDGPCHIVAPSSTGLALVALDGAVETVSKDGGRVILAEQFFTMPSLDVTRETSLQPGEIISRIRVLPPSPRTISSYVKVREKETFDWPIAEAAVVLAKSDGGKVEKARIVLGAAAPVPWRALDAEKALIGNTVSEKTARDAAGAALAGATPMSGNAYKVGLLREVVRRAILSAA